MAIDPVSLQLTQNTRINPAQEGQGATRRLNISGDGENSFADLIRDSIRSVDQMQKTTEANVEAVLAGKAENIHEVVIAMEKAQLSFQLMVEIRNKALETYQELSRMQL